MKLISTAAALVLLMSFGWAANAQMTKGGPAEVKQSTGDPMINEPTAEQLKRNPGLARRDRGPTAGQVGGPPGDTRTTGNGNGG